MLKQLNIFWPLLLALALLWIYAPILTEQPILGRDDMQILQLVPSEISTQSLHALFNPAQNPDLQPVRDFSFYLDRRLSRSIGYQTFHLTNLLLFGLALFFLWRLIRSPLLVALVALHPLSVMSVAWISARKYLLVSVFLLLATDFLRRKKSAGLLTAFAAALGAQPVAVYWPFWALLFRRTLKPLVLAALLAVLWAYIQTKHYGSYFSAQDLSMRSAQLGGWRQPRELLLALGRATWQIIVPTNFAVTYSPDSWQNLAGTGLLGLILFVVVRLRLLPTARWLAFGFFPLLLTLAKVQNLFFSDSYALLLLFAVALALVELPKSRVAICAGLVLLPCFAWQSRQTTAQWQNDLALWRQAYRQEPDCFGSLALATQLYKQKIFTEAVEVSKFHLRGCNDSLNQQLFAMTIFYDQVLNDQEKLASLQRLPEADPMVRILLVAQALKARDWGLVERVWGSLEKQNLTGLYSFHLSPLLDAINGYCPVGSPQKLCVKLHSFAEKPSLSPALDDAFRLNWRP